MILRNFGNLGHYFNALTRRAEDRRIFRVSMAALFEAVITGEKDDALHLIAQLEPMPKFDTLARGMVLQSAFANDNPEMFVALVQTIWPSVNKPVKTLHVRSARFRMQNERHLLYYAIDKGAEKIALALARNPAVDVTLSGTRLFMYGKCRTRKSHYRSPLSLATKKDMHAVVTAITARLTGDLAAKARKPSVTR